MLNTYGNSEQFHFLNSISSKDSPSYSLAQISLIENSEFFSISEKLELLELLLGLRFLTEVSDNITYGPKRKDGFSYPKLESIKRLTDFISKELKLELSISKKKSMRSHRFLHQVNIFSNKALKDYFVKYERKVSPLEIGMLYGYHPKAVLAFCGYIESSPPPKPKLAYQFFNSLVFPKDFYEEVDSYHKHKWSKLSKLAPNLVKKAEDTFKHQIKTFI